MIVLPNAHCGHLCPDAGTGVVALPNFATAFPPRAMRRPRFFGSVRLPRLGLLSNGIQADGHANG